MEDHILIRYGELSLKKSNRKQFINKINSNIKRACRAFKNLTYESRGLRFYIILHQENAEKICNILKKNSWYLFIQCGLTLRIKYGGDEEVGTKFS